VAGAATRQLVATGITSTLSAGSHVIDLICFEEGGRVNVEDTRITAIALD